MTGAHSPSNTGWKVVIVDDDPSVHDATKELISQLSFAGKRFMGLSAFSYEKARELLQKDDDIALVIMDSEVNGQAIGLGLIGFIKEELQNEKVRILLRTGYPYLVPDKRIAEKYAIDGSLPDEEFSEKQLRLAVLGAIQTYHQIETVTNYLRGLGGTIAHEMRNPLSQVKQGFSILKKELSRSREQLSKEDFETMDSMVDMGSNVCERANMMIDMLLQNIKNEKINPATFKVVSIAEVVQTAVGEYAFSGSEQREAVRLALDQDFECKGDDTLLIYVLFNLLKNALFFFPTKLDFQIAIRLEKGEENNALYFRDTGPGIPKEKRSTIFDSFMTSGKKGGTGLGLAFCKRVMTAFGGNIECDSVVGQWTEFTLTFPHQLRI